MALSTHLIAAVKYAIYYTATPVDRSEELDSNCVVWRGSNVSSAPVNNNYKMQLVEKLQKFGVGRRALDTEFFRADKVPARFGIYDEEEEDLCHDVITASCTIPGCMFTATSLLDFENHYNSSHRYCCGECRRALPSPHLLDLHIQETHDSFFAVMAARKPSYSCYIQECTNKFLNAEERLDHCFKVHKLPKDFRFEMKAKSINKPKKKSKSQNMAASMDVDATVSYQATEKILFRNSKQKGLIKYSGKKFTLDKANKSLTMTNMDEIMSDLKENLPK